jgi:hypothetical protein
MSVNDILDGAFKLLRANARAILLTVAVFIVPVELVIGFLQRNTLGGRGFFTAINDPSSQGSSGSPWQVLFLHYGVSVLLVPLICGGVSRAVVASYLGKELTPGQCITAALRRTPALLVATILVHLAEAVAAVPCLIGLVFVMPLFVMVAPAIAIEEIGPWAGIRRSWRLVARRYWPTVGTVLLAGVLAYVLGQILGLVPNLVALVVGFRWGWILISASGILVSFVTIPVVTIVATLLYLDARIRQEGFDLHLMAERLEQAGNGRSGDLGR